MPMSYDRKIQNKGTKILDPRTFRENQIRHNLIFHQR